MQVQVTSTAVTVMVLLFVLPSASVAVIVKSLLDADVMKSVKSNLNLKSVALVDEAVFTVSLHSTMRVRGSMMLIVLIVPRISVSPSKLTLLIAARRVMLLPNAPNIACVSG